MARASGGEVHYAQDAEEAARKIIIDPLLVDGGEDRHQGQDDDRRGDRPQSRAGGGGDRARSKPTSASTSFNCATKLPSRHPRARDPPQGEADVEEGIPQGASRSARRSQSRGTGTIAGRSAPGAAGKFLTADVGITGANSPHRRNRNLDHRHQRRQRRPDPNPAAGPHRHRLNRKIVPDARGRGATLARAGALGDRPGRRSTRRCRSGRAGRGDPEWSEGSSCRDLSTMAVEEAGRAIRAIRCAASAAAACMNHCPVYQAVGGHAAWGRVYPGPMGAVLTPRSSASPRAAIRSTPRPSAAAARRRCPVRIPLPGMMRHWREREFERRLSPPQPLRPWPGIMFDIASRPALYRLATGLAARAMHLAGRGKGRFSWLPFAGGWTRYRDLAAPEGSTFQSQWRARSGAVR